MIDLHQPLSEEELTGLCKSIAERVVGVGMTTPTLLLLEMHRPLANLASHAMVALSPILAPALGIEGIGKLSRLVHHPESLGRLIEAIESHAEGTREGK